MTRVVLRPVGSALPLGLLGLCVGSVLLSALQLSWVSTSQATVIAVGLLSAVAPAQALTSVLGFLSRDTVCGTGVGVLAGTWAGAGATLLVVTPGSTSPGLGVLLVTAAGTLLVPTVTAATSKVLVAIVLASASVRFALSGIYELTGSLGWRHAAGIAGLVVATIACYGALAFELESALGHTVLPVLRHHQGRRAVSGRLSDQLAHLTTEAGVREQL